MPGFEPDYVLLVVGVEIYKKDVKVRGSLGFAKRTATRFDAGIVLWDNTAGEMIATGTIDSGKASDRLSEIVEAFVVEVDRQTPLGAR